MTGTPLKRAAVAAVIVLSAAGTAAAGTAAMAIDVDVAAASNTKTVDSSSNNNDSKPGMITFPLIPHHAHRRRLGLPEFEDNVGEDRGQRRRSLQARTNTDTSREVMSQLYMGYGTHYVDLWCGTPPQRQTVIVDTGSVQTAFPGEECDDCGYPRYHIDPYFQETKSSTFSTWGCDSCSQRTTCNRETDRCEIEQYYSEGSSWTAYEAIDTCYVGGFHNTALTKDNGGNEDIDPGHAAAYKFDTRISIQTDVTGLFKTQLADGIMGMCDGKQSFWHQMYRAHKIKEKQFSLCFVRPVHAYREGSEAGAVTMGGVDERLHNTPMVYTSTVGTSSERGTNDKTGYYDVHVREMYLRDGKAGASILSKDSGAPVVKLNGASAINDEGGVIVDSGTTDTYFSNSIKKTLQKNWEQLAGIPYSHDKTELTEEQVAKLPTLLIQFAGDEELNKAIAKGKPNQIPGLAGDLDKNHPYDVVIAIPPKHYMERLSDGNVMNRVYETEEDGTVLGANSMMGHDVFFDAQNMRLGWAESDCEYSSLVKEGGYPSVMGDSTESKDEEAQDDAEASVQDTEKEKFDESNTQAEIEEDNDNIEEMLAEEGVDEHFTKSKQHHYTNTIEIPLDDIIDNPEIAGVAVGILFLLTSLCVHKCCCTTKARRRRKRRKQQRKEIELHRHPGRGLGGRGGVRGGYRDNFRDESDDGYSDGEDNSDDYSDDDDFGGGGEYGLSKGL